jgi:hypothetical protein
VPVPRRRDHRAPRLYHQGADGADRCQGVRARWRQGGAVQVDPVKPTLKAPGSKRLKLKHDEPLSNFAFKISLRRYTKVGETGERGSEVCVIQGRPDVVANAAARVHELLASRSLAPGISFQGPSGNGGFLPNPVYQPPGQYGAGPPPGQYGRAWQMCPPHHPPHF